MGNGKRDAMGRQNASFRPEVRERINAKLRDPQKRAEISAKLIAYHQRVREALAQQATKEGDRDA